MSQPILAVDGVDFSYRAGSPVLQQCSLGIAPGERVALQGDNGSGKTTLLHLMVGLLHPQAGRITAFGAPRRVESDFHEVRRRVGLLFQDTDDQLFCPTVAEDVAFGPMNLGFPRERVRQIVSQTLDSLGLAGYEHRVTYRLSGGEKRLVALATVLAMEPEVLLLDEPTAGLDHHATLRLLSYLVRLPQAMLIVSHDDSFCSRLATKTLLLESGRTISPD